MTWISGVRIDALGEHFAISAECQTCWHTAPVPLEVVLAKRRLARRGLLQDLNGRLRCTRCQSTVNNVFLVSLRQNSRSR